MNEITSILIGFVVVVGCALGLAYGCPSYIVYTAEMGGKATFARAEQDRLVLVEEARAKNKAAELDAESRVIRAKAEATAEIERAKGVAEANRIIADGLGGAEGYLRYLFIQALGGAREGDVVYIPTEAGLPILEAGRK